MPGAENLPRDKRDVFPQAVLYDVPTPTKLAEEKRRQALTVLTAPRANVETSPKVNAVYLGQGFQAH